MDINREKELLEAAGIVYLTCANCRFEKKGDFVSLDLLGNEAKNYSRVNLHRLFPFDRPYSYISVLDSDSQEIGIIAEIGDFDEETCELLKHELDRKYYVCDLISVSSVKDRFGFSYWKVQSTAGEITFTIRDTHNSLRENIDGKISISDIDGNRYTLPPLAKLDKKSRRLVELYL
ncbi:MAG: DUF1854 domain-containing protein [Clostridia bacterium]|nr:DUF1854 domain-containing protein [Clostridia bacterium]